DVHRLETVRAGRIDLAPPWRLEGEPTDLLALVVQAAGTSVLTTDGDAGSIVLRTGDVIIQPHGGNRPGQIRTYFHDGSNPTAVTRHLSIRTSTPATFKPLRLTRNASCSLVFCLMRMQGLPSGPLWAGLPELIHLPADQDGHDGMLRRTIESIIEESAEPGPAATRLLSRLAETLPI